MAVNATHLQLILTGGVGSSRSPHFRTTGLFQTPAFDYRPRCGLRELLFSSLLSIITLCRIRNSFGVRWHKYQFWLGGRIGSRSETRHDARETPVL